MEDKVILYCGECEKFDHEDTDGYGICGKTKEVCYCCDKCHITHGNHERAKIFIMGKAKNMLVCSH